MLRASDCIPLFRHWIAQNNRVCETLCLPLDAACAALLPWRFSGRGAAGTLFEGAVFPYTITGSMAKCHGVSVTRETVAFMQQHISVYSQHPLILLAMYDTFNNTACEAQLARRLDALWLQGPLVFYRNIFRVEQPCDVLRIQTGSAPALLVDELIKTFQILCVATTAGRTPHGTIIIRFPAVPCIDVAHIGDGSNDTITWECLDQSTVTLITHADAAVIRLFIPQIDVMFVLKDIKYV